MSAGVKEGFLCPVCLEDLESVLRLQAHFEQAHQNPEDSNAILQSFKGALGRAKQVIREDILKNDLLAGLASGGRGAVTVVSDLHKSASSASLGTTSVGTSNVAGSSSSVRKVDPTPEYDPETWSHQPMGASRSHLPYFKRFKQNRSERYATETNKLILRLDKLVGGSSEGQGRSGSGSPSRIISGRKREYERAVVPWVDDSVVKLCPECAKSFGITNRRHHCRLCGMVMCQNCSCFVAQDMSRRLTSVVKAAVTHQNSDPDPSFPPSSAAKSSRSGSLLRVGRRDSSESTSSTKFSVSLNDIRDLTSSLKATLNPDSVGGSSDAVRVCKHCFALLGRRLDHMEFANDRPELLELYERLKAAMAEGETHVPKYLEMIEYLHSGHPGYSLADAQGLRQKILKAAETVDFLSKKISFLGIKLPAGNEVDAGEEEEPPPQPDPKLLQLQGQIRSYAIYFLKARMIGLPPLPSRDQVEKAKEERALNIQRKMARAEEEDRRLSRKDGVSRDVRPTSTTTTTTTSSSSTPVALSWTPRTDSAARSALLRDEDDPLLQQIRIIESYVDQARAANRKEEVATLEANLLELIDAFHAKVRV